MNASSELLSAFGHSSRVDTHCPEILDFASSVFCSSAGCSREGHVALITSDGFSRQFPLSGTLWGHAKVARASQRPASQRQRGKEAANAPTTLPPTLPLLPFWKSHSTTTRPCFAFAAKTLHYISSVAASPPSPLHIPHYSAPINLVDATKFAGRITSLLHSNRISSQKGGP